MFRPLNTVVEGVRLGRGPFTGACCSLGDFDMKAILFGAAGLAALPFLQGHGLAACTVAHSSARIGEARSTLADGVLSHCNEAAIALGLAPGQACRELPHRLGAAADGS